MQIRADEHVAKEELESFVRHAELEHWQIEVLNIYKQQSFDVSVLDGMDSLWVGGASDANVLQPTKYPFIKKAQELLYFCYKQNIPVFASCFGFQLAVLALGGEIVNSDKDFEMGTLPISLADAASTDKLFCDTPDQFVAVSVHQQKAVELPPECELLAYTDKCIHAFKVKSKLFWAFQFHPEVDKKILIKRLTIYKEKYTEGDTHLAQVLSQAMDTPESNILMKKFVDRILLG